MCFLAVLGTEIERMVMFRRERMDELVDSILRDIGRPVVSDVRSEHGGEVVPGKHRAMI